MVPLGDDTIAANVLTHYGLDADIPRLTRLGTEERPLAEGKQEARSVTNAVSGMHERLPSTTASLSVVTPLVTSTHRLQTDPVSHAHVSNGQQRAQARPVFYKNNRAQGSDDSSITIFKLFSLERES